MGCAAMVLGWTAVMAGKRTTRAIAKVPLTLYAHFLSVAVVLGINKGISYTSARSYRNKPSEEQNLLTLRECE